MLTLQNHSNKMNSTGLVSKVSGYTCGTLFQKLCFPPNSYTAEGSSREMVQLGNQKVTSVAVMLCHPSQGMDILATAFVCPQMRAVGEMHIGVAAFRSVHTVGQVSYGLQYPLSMYCSHFLALGFSYIHWLILVYCHYICDIVWKQRKLTSEHTINNTCIPLLT